MKNRYLKQIAAFGIFSCLLLGMTQTVSATDVADSGAEEVSEETIQGAGGGYAATGQIEGVGYTSQLYDATNGLPTSDANYILGDNDGYVWIGGYSGVIRYDGTTFERLDTSDGMTSGRVLFEDSANRIWLGTNDNGVVIMHVNHTSTHLTRDDGLPASSIRSFAEDLHGNIYVGTTDGICWVDENLKVHILDDSGINGQRVTRLEADATGVIYGLTGEGIAFSVEDGRITQSFDGTSLDGEQLTALLVDPIQPGNVYLGTDTGAIYYGAFGAPVESQKKISADPITDVHWLSYECDRIWVNSSTQIGYLDENNGIHVLDDIVLENAIEMTTSDYQGNLWATSTTQGIMKIVTSNFVDVTKNAGLPEEVTNATCLCRDGLYVGTDEGLFFLKGKDRIPTEDELTEYLAGTRIRCVIQDSDGNIWVSTFNNDKGLVRYTPEGTITSFTEENGMPSDQVRCVKETSDGSIVAGTNGGLAILDKQSDTIRVVDADDGAKNTVFLTVEEGEDGKLYVGTDGDGIYVINGNTIETIGWEDGLTSDVVLKVIRDPNRDLYWVITSNSIEYLKDGKLTNVSTFPYNNNFDLYFDQNDDLWVLSSYGIFAVKAEEMLKDEVTDYRTYTLANGLTAVPNSNSYSALDERGNLYIAGRTGASLVNINDYFDGSTAHTKMTVSAIYNGEEEVQPEDDGSYTLPPDAARIRIEPSIMDFTLENPLVRVYLEGAEDDGITASRDQFYGLEYTGLQYGDYTLHIQILDHTGTEVVTEETVAIRKTPGFFELKMVRFLIAVLMVLAAGFVVWRFMKTTIVSRQYDEIRAAKEEAERANTAKSRFLANMSHEIRTPINTIMGMDEMILREDAAGVPKNYFMSVINYALDIRSASESLLGLINDLLDMSKVESGKMHLVEMEYDTQDLLRSIVSMIRVRSTEKELSFDVVIDEILPQKLFGDAGKIKQIVLNLLTNAVKYTAVGGFVLEVSMEERQDDVCSLRFSVKDTGIGVKEEDMDKLFTAYERLDEEKNSNIQGTGLGLDISRKFAELMQGSLVCESVYGEGSEFILSVDQKIIDATPIGVFVEHDDSEEKGPYVPKFVAPDADVLVVDDNPMNLNVIKGLLKATKVYVTTANSGEECLEKIRSTDFNIVLLDHMMPGMDGVETVAEIRKTHPDLPVYALTANATSGEAFYISKGFNGYLSKPIDSPTLERTIMKHLPEQMMMQPDGADVVEEPGEIPVDMEWIRKTEGISVEEGVKNSGGISNFIFSLKLFLETIDDNARVITDAHESDNIRMYTIKVHALKSSARIIGAMELSHLAEQLEDAGNKGDKIFIDTYTPQLMTDYLAYKEKLARLSEDEDDANKEPIPAEELQDAYDALRDVVPQMDYDSVEMILEQVKAYRLPDADAQKMKQLGKLLKGFAWDEMEALLGQ